MFVTKMFFFLTVTLQKLQFSKGSFTNCIAIILRAKVVGSPFQCACISIHTVCLTARFGWFTTVPGNGVNCQRFTIALVFVVSVAYTNPNPETNNRKCSFQYCVVDMQCCRFKYLTNIARYKHGSTKVLCLLKVPRLFLACNNISLQFV